ncbi:MAG: hypothetical protein FWF44_11625, partial [Defluviitaleaceae bacterium]|nr:hypothetical protein [Defluviitaleaceae bacterium]
YYDFLETVLLGGYTGCGDYISHCISRIISSVDRALWRFLVLAPVSLLRNCIHKGMDDALGSVIRGCFFTKDLKMFRLILRLAKEMGKECGCPCHC